MPLATTDLERHPDPTAPGCGFDQPELTLEPTSPFGGLVSPRVLPSELPRQLGLGPAAGVEGSVPDDPCERGCAARTPIIDQPIVENEPGCRHRNH